jgi:hypothetical protein
LPNREAGFHDRGLSLELARSPAVRNQTSDYIQQHGLMIMDGLPILDAGDHGQIVQFPILETKLGTPPRDRLIDEAEPGRGGLSVSRYLMKLSGDRPEGLAAHGFTDSLFRGEEFVDVSRRETDLPCQIGHRRFLEAELPKM